jgi:hypothetical protein
MPLHSAVTFLMAPVASLMFDLCPIQPTICDPQFIDPACGINYSLQMQKDALVAPSISVGVDHREGYSYTPKMSNEPYYIIRKQSVDDLIEALDTVLDREYYDQNLTFDKTVTVIKWSTGDCRKLLRDIRFEGYGKWPRN